MGGEIRDGGGRAGRVRGDAFCSPFEVHLSFFLSIM